MRCVMCVLVIALGSGCQDEAGEDPLLPAGPQSAPDPSTFGPYPVGVRTVALEDPTRGADGPRPVVIEVWYPATEDERDAEGYVYDLDDFLRPEVLSVIDTEALAASFATTAVRDAEPRTEDGPYPVVVFSHGSGGMRMQSPFFTVALASHGYVVAAPDHVGNTLSDLILTGLEQDAVLESFVDRPIDLDFTVDALAGLGNDDPLADMTDLGRLGVAGHSFGALTAIRWMGLGAPVSAVVAQAPPAIDLTWLTVQTPLAEFDTPLMLHVGGADLTTPPSDAETVWSDASAPRSRLTLATGGHFTFSDLCQLDPDALAAVAEAGIIDALDDGCGPANTAPEVALPAVRHFGIGWFNAHLRNSGATLDLLTQAEGERLAGDEVTFELELLP